MKKVLLIAHRAGGMGVAENKLETLKATLKKRYIDAVEVDIRVTKDNVLVIHHDRGIYMSGKRVWIDKIEYAKIKHLGVSTFDEVMPLFIHSDVILNIDVKDERCILPLKQAFIKYKFKKKFYLDCFDLNVLLNLQEELPTGEYFLSLTPKDSFDFNRRFVVRILILLSTLFFSQLIVYFLRKKIKKIKIDGISIYYKFAKKSFISDLKAFGFKVFVWGTDREFDIEYFLKSGVDGIKTRNIAYFEKLS